MLSESIVNDLVCPIGKYPLIADGDMLVCTNCNAKYPVSGGIPLLLIDDVILPDGVNSINELKCYKQREAKENQS